MLDTTDTTRTIFTVYGPTAEWADGSGPLFVTDSLKSAGMFVREERRLTIDHAADVVSSAEGNFTMLGDVFMSEDASVRLGNAFLASDGYSRRAYDAAKMIVGWPTNTVGYWLERSTVGDLLNGSGWTLDDFEDFEDFLERMNER